MEYQIICQIYPSSKELEFVTRSALPFLSCAATFPKIPCLPHCSIGDTMTRHRRGKIKI